MKAAAEAGREAASGRPPRRRLRRPVAVLLSRFPLITETFILREIEEMERQGQEVVLVPLLRESPGVVHREAVPWVERALYVPLLSADVLAANLRALAARPGPYLRLLGRALAGSLRRPRSFLGTLAFFPKAVRLAGLLEARGVRHIHAHFATHPAMAAMIASCFSGTGYSFTAHAHDIYVPWRRSLLAEKVRRARFVRTISEHGRERLRALVPDVDPQRIRVVHVGIEPELYQAGDARNARGPCSASAPGARVLSVAALEPYKGLPVLVEACRILAARGRDLHCDVVGRGRLERRLRRAVRRAGIEERFHLLGALPQDEVAGLVARADLFVLPSVVARDGQMEGIPVALMEAMAARRAVVASRLSGIPELVEDGVSGRLVPPGDPEALAREMERLLDDAPLRRRMGEAGRRKVGRDFRLSGCTARLLEEIAAADEPLPPELARALHESGAPWLEGGFRIVAVGEGPDSAVARLRVEGSEAELVYKVQRSRPGQSRPPAERARREHRALVRLRALLEDGPASPGVPLPLHLDEDLGGLLMEACRGERLDLLVRCRRLPGLPPPPEVEEGVALCGTWLRTVQDGTEGPADPAEALAGLVTRARGALRACRSAGLAPDEAAGTARFLERAAARLGSSNLRAAARHGDFWPGNAFVLPARGRVEVVDLEGAGEGLIEEDPATFLLHLDLYHLGPGLERRRRRLARRFLEAWSGGRQPDATALALARAACALTLLEREILAPPQESAWLRHRRRVRTRTLSCACRGE